MHTSSRSVEAMRPAAAPSARPRSPSLWVGAGLLAAAVAAGGWWAVRQRGAEPSTVAAETATRPAVAVLAFEVVSGGPDIARPRLWVVGFGSCATPKAGRKNIWPNTRNSTGGASPGSNSEIGIRPSRRSNASRKRYVSGCLSCSRSSVRSSQDWTPKHGASFAVRCGRTLAG